MKRTELHGTGAQNGRAGLDGWVGSCEGESDGRMNRVRSVKTEHCKMKRREWDEEMKTDVRESK